MNLSAPLDVLGFHSSFPCDLIAARATGTVVRGVGPFKGQSMLDYAHSRREALADAQSPANPGGMESKAGGQLRGLGYAEQVAALAPSGMGGGAATHCSRGSSGANAVSEIRCDAAA